MTEETAIKAKELYEQKSELSTKISKLISVPVSGITYSIGNDYYVYGPLHIDTKKYNFNEEIKELVLTRLKELLKEVENQIANL